MVMQVLRQLILIALTATTAMATVADVGAPTHDGAAKRQGADLAGFAERVAQSLAHADEVEVLEGLPHPTGEREVFAAEKAATRNFSLHGDLFYEETRKLDGMHRKAFLALWPVMVSPFRGAKTCGGFHADYALRWKEGDRAGAVLICFGCHEVAAFLPEGDLRADLKGNGVLELREVLRAYRKQRPAP